MSRTPASERVIHHVADATDSDVLDLPPLYDAIDPDALDALIEGLSDGDVSFHYAGCEVTIDSDETVSLEVRSVESTTATMIPTSG